MSDAITMYRTAAHEAAHAAVADALGVTVRRIEVGNDLESGCTYFDDCDINRNALITLAPAAFDGSMSASDEAEFAKLCDRDPTLRTRRQHLLSELQRMRRETIVNRNHDIFRNLLMAHGAIVNLGNGEWVPYR